MAVFQSDNALDCYSEDIAAFENDREPMSESSDKSIGHGELRKSLFSETQDSNSAAPSACKEEEEDQYGGKKYLALSPSGDSNGLSMWSSDCPYSPISPPSVSTLFSESSLLANICDSVGMSESFSGLNGSSTSGCSFGDSVWKYSPGSDLHCAAEPLHNSGGQQDIPCGPPPYCSYWRGYQTIEEPAQPTPNPPEVVNTPLTPPDSPQPQSRLSTSLGFLELVKACVSNAVRVAVIKQVKKDCYGCEFDRPSQKDHPCLFPLPEYYFEMNFEKIMLSLLSWEFIPALKSTLTKIGVDLPEAKVEGVADAFLFDLKSEENILDKTKEIIDEFTSGGEEKELLLDYFIDFWSP